MLLAPPLAAAPVIPPEMERCLSIKNDRERLRCFDGAAQDLAGLPDDGRRKVSVLDIILDFKALDGQFVSVDGLISVSSKTRAMLMLPSDRRHWIWANLEQIDPATLRRLFECQDECPIRVTGKIETFSFFFDGLTVHTVEFRSAP